MRGGVVVHVDISPIDSILLFKDVRLREQDNSKHMKNTTFHYELNSVLAIRSKQRIQDIIKQ